MVWWCFGANMARQRNKRVKSCRTWMELVTFFVGLRIER